MRASGDFGAATNSFIYRMWRRRDYFGQRRGSPNAPWSIFLLHVLLFWVMNHIMVKVAVQSLEVSEVCMTTALTHDRVVSPRMKGVL